MKKVRRPMLMSLTAFIALIISSMMAFASPNGDNRGNNITSITESEVHTAYYLENNLEQSYRFDYYNWRYLKDLRPKGFREISFLQYEVLPSTEAIGEYQPATGTIVGRSLKTNFTQVGKYYVKIKAYFHTNPEVAHIQTVKIDVKQANEVCGTLYGGVVFRDELPFPAERTNERVTVVFTRLGAPEYNAETTQADLIGKMYFIAKTDTADQFRLDVPAGLYTVRYLCPEMNVDVYEHFLGEKEVYEVITGEEVRVVTFVIEPDPAEENTASEVTIDVNMGGDNIMYYVGSYPEIVDNNLVRMLSGNLDSVRYFAIDGETQYDNLGDYKPLTVSYDHKLDRAFFKADAPGQYYFKLLGYPVLYNGFAHLSHRLTVKVNVLPAKTKCATVKGKFILPENVPDDIKASSKFSVKLVDTTFKKTEDLILNPQFDGLVFFSGESNNEFNFSIPVPEGIYTMNYSCKLLGVSGQFVSSFVATCENETDLGDIVIDYVNVPDTNCIAKLTGTLYVGNNEDYNDVVIYAVPTDDNPIKQLLPEAKYYAEKGNISGKSAPWIIKLPVGRYILFGQLRDTTIGGKTVLADTVSLRNYKMDFRFKKSDNFKYKTLKAKVYDATTEEHLRSSISLIPVGVSGFLAELPTDKIVNGVSIFRIPAEFIDRYEDSPVKFKMLATAWDSRYKPQLYNTVYSLAEAQEITLDDNYDTNTVYLFPMEQYPDPNATKNRIYGHLKHEDSAVSGFINLIKKPEGNSTEFKFFNAPTEADGYFEFKNVKPGRYMLFAVPLQGQVMPGFYREGTTASSIWEEATEITIADNATDSILVNCEISLLGLGVNNGSGKIAGTVSGNSSSGKVVAGFAANEGLNSAFMSIFDSKGNAIRSCNTDQNGRFSFSKLLPGTYKVTASIYGYQSLSQNITIGSTDSDINFEGAQFVLEPAMSNVKDAKELSVYPNPAKAMVSIDFPAEAGNANISIIDALGNTVYSNTITTVDGDNSYKYNTQNMANGLYLITIELNNGKRISTLLTVIK